MALEQLETILLEITKLLKRIPLKHVKSSLVLLEKFNAKPTDKRKNKLLEGLSNAVHELSELKRGNEDHFKEWKIDDLIDILIKQSEKLQREGGFDLGENVIKELLRPMYVHLCYGKCRGQLIGKPYDVQDWTRFRAKGSTEYHPDISRDGYFVKNSNNIKINKEISELTAEKQKLEKKKFILRKSRLNDKILALGNKIYALKKRKVNLDVLKIPPGDLGGYKSFKEKYLGEKFEATLIGRQIGKSYIFNLIYYDNTLDNRGYCISYGLLIPNQKINSVVPLINKTPEIVIETFRKAYPGFDESEGKLRIVKKELS